jgi:anti-sigma B factor antagonist
VDIVERTVGDVTVLELRGKLVLGDGPEQLRERVGRVTAQGRSRIVLHLEQVPFVDSAGLGEIVRTHAAVQRLEGGLRLVRPAQRILDLLAITRIRHIFDVRDSEEEAVASLQAGA